MYKETFGQKLRTAREQAGYTQRQITEITGIKQPTLASYETGRREPDIETLGKLADFYNVSVDWLIGTNGNNKKHP